MTELGRSLFEEGLEEGKLNKSIEIAKIAISKGMSNELISELIELPIEQIQIIRIAIKND